VRRNWCCQWQTGKMRLFPYLETVTSVYQAFSCCLNNDAWSRCSCHRGRSTVMWYGCSNAKGNWHLLFRPHNQCQEFQ
jgi:hypothetical protein